MAEERVEVPWGGPTSDALRKFRDLARRDNRWTAWAGLADDSSAPWVVEVTWDVSDTHAVPTGVALRSRTGQPVTAAAWRAVRVEEVVGWTRHVLGWGADRAAEHYSGHGQVGKADRARQLGEAVRDTGQQDRRRVYDAAHYAEVAAVYSRAQGSASRAPVRAVALAFADRYPGITTQGDSRAKAWVREARRRGYIEEG